MHKNKAFTLIELLVVIAIIIILLGILSPLLKGCVDKRKKPRQANVITLYESNYIRPV